MSRTQTIHHTLPKPANPLVTALLTDLYQITMVYAYWKSGRHEEPAIFELFFRKCPFKGEFTVFAGLEECLKHVHHFSFTAEDIAYLKKDVPSLSHCEDAFFDWLAQLDSSGMTLRALPEGSLCFPREPLILVEGPLAVGQLLETTLLTLVNYPSLLTTNAVRMSRAAHGKPVDDTHELPAQCHKLPTLVEFGLRRAQGPDGGFSASKYAIVGGFQGTSNVSAGYRCHIPVTGTHAHAFVQSYHSLDQVDSSSELYRAVMHYREQYRYEYTNDGELAAFIAYAIAFPDSFLCLIDTYDTLNSGLLNFTLVALALDDLGYTPRGVRLDSGDLAALSMGCARHFAKFASDRPFMKDLDIVASNDINENTLEVLNEQPHAITSYGIGTNLVTCQSQPALGCVYKLVEIREKARIKFSQDVEKVLIPGQKRAFRLWGKDNKPLMDVLLGTSEEAILEGERRLFRHPFHAQDRAYVTPTKVEPLHVTYIQNGNLIQTPRTLAEAAQEVQNQLKAFPPCILQAKDPEAYSVWVSPHLYQKLHQLWEEYAPVQEIN